MSRSKLPSKALDIISSTEPTNPSKGHFWFDTSNNVMKTYNGSSWDQMSNKFSAQGGNISIVGAYKYHTFTSSGSLTVEGSGSIDILIVAGGGGGGRNRGGGGGAGGYISSTEHGVVTGTYTITVGAGGNQMTASQDSANGGNSSAFGMTAIGGGRGGGNGIGNSNDPYPRGFDGGSGGGAGSVINFSGGAGTAGQGNAGGSVIGNSNGAGGGGAGGVGTNSSSTSGTGGFVNGGAGLAWLDGVTYARGGGGATTPDYNGQNTSTPNTANTGNGGGGGTGNVDGMSGASGIVIIRYAI